MKVRYYDSKAGRFISEDPSGFDGGDVNFSAYVKGNPISFTDQSGLCISTLQAAGTGAFTGAVGGSLVASMSGQDPGLGALIGGTTGLTSGVTVGRTLGSQILGSIAINASAGFFGALAAGGSGQGLLASTVVSGAAGGIGATFGYVNPSLGAAIGGITQTIFSVMQFGFWL